MNPAFTVQFRSKVSGIHDKSLEDLVDDYLELEQLVEELREEINELKDRLNE
jgi:archaellum component FlaC